MTFLRWAETSRERLRELLPDALVVLPLGATEQHGPHLPTGTDALIATTVAERAAEQASRTCPNPLIVTPPIAVGASGHHIGFGGTLSVEPHTLLSVLTDLSAAIAAAGGCRLALINGHGGNTGICHAAASAAATRHELTVAHLDYWQLAPQVADTPVPGHAGQFETAVLLALRPDLVADPPERRHTPESGDEGMHSMNAWRAIDGYTDAPHRARAVDGRRWLEAIVADLTQRLSELGTA